MKKALVILVVVVALVVAGAAWFAIGASYGEGFRVGKVIKLSHKGYLFKTWEGTLDFGYLQNDPEAGVATRIWDFSVAPGDTEVRAQIDAAIAGDYKVKLHYEEKYVRLFWRGDTKYLVTKVERAS
jgi:hypothetical protein